MYETSTKKSAIKPIKPPLKYQHTKIVLILAAFAILFLAVIFVAARLTPMFSSKRSVVVKVLLDAGHTKEDNYAKGIAGEEYAINYKVTSHLAKLLENDSRFYVEQTRGEIDYLPKIYETAELEAMRFQALADVILDGEARSLEERAVKLRKKLYGVRYYGLRNGFDVLLSVHFDSRWWLKRGENGFHSIVSPYSKRLADAILLAEAVNSSMGNDYSISEELFYATNEVPVSISNKYNPVSLLEKGISMRTLLVLGDGYERAYYSNAVTMAYPENMVSVLVECGYVYEEKFANDSELKNVATNLYKALTNYYNVRY